MFMLEVYLEAEAKHDDWVSDTIGPHHFTPVVRIVSRPDTRLYVDEQHPQE